MINKDDAMTPSEAVAKAQFQLAKEIDKKRFILDIEPDDVPEPATDWNFPNPDYLDF